MRPIARPGLFLATLFFAGCDATPQETAVSTMPPPSAGLEISAEELAAATERAAAVPPGSAAEQGLAAEEPAPAKIAAPPGEPPQTVTAESAFQAIVAHIAEGLPRAVAGLANRGAPGVIAHEVIPPNSPQSPYRAVVTFTTRNASSESQSTCMWTANYEFMDSKWTLLHLEWQVTSFSRPGNAAPSGRRSRDVMELKKVVFNQRKPGASRSGTPPDIVAQYDAIIQLLMGQ